MVRQISIVSVSGIAILQEKESSENIIKHGKKNVLNVRFYQGEKSSEKTVSNLIRQIRAIYLSNISQYLQEKESIESTVSNVLRVYRPEIKPEYMLLLSPTRTCFVRSLKRHYKRFIERIFARVSRSVTFAEHVQVRYFFVR